MVYFNGESNNMKTTALILFVLLLLISRAAAGENVSPWILVEGDRLESGALGGKLIHEERGIQIPVLLDLARLEGFRHRNPVPEGEGWWPLHKGTYRASSPQRPAKESLAFTAGEELVVLTKDPCSIIELQRMGQRSVRAGALPGAWRGFACDLGCATEQFALTSDLRKVAFCDFDEHAIKICDFETDTTVTVIDRFEGTPLWSPDSGLLVVVNSGQGIRLVPTPEAGLESASRFLTFAPRQSGYVYFGKPSWSRAGAGAAATTELVVPVQISTGIAVQASGKLFIDPIATFRRPEKQIDLTPAVFAGGLPGIRFTPGAVLEKDPVVGTGICFQADVAAAPRSRPLSDRPTVSGVPFLHQVYDTPDWFDGNWACGPSSCMMAVQKYKKLPYWLTHASWPSAHTSQYGSFVSGLFDHNGTTFDWVSYDASGRPARGAYGYICPGGAAYWDRMNNFMQWCGCTTYYDSSPSWSELTANINAGRTCVLSTMLTSAGHIVLAIGYNSNHSVIVRDPYGNKASGYPNYQSVATYDWPGYNNGNYNLQTVSLIIGVTGSKSGLAAIIDDSTANVPRCKFEKFGPSQYWWESDTYGTGSPGGSHSSTNGMYYTYSEQTGSWICWVQWGFQVTSAGNYKIEVFVPQNNATTTNAEYYHYHSATGQNLLQSVNQNNYYDDWVTLSSSYNCRFGWNAVRLGDVTGETSATKIGVDAIRVTKR